MLSSANGKDAGSRGGWDHALLSRRKAPDALGAGHAPDTRFVAVPDSGWGLDRNRDPTRRWSFDPGPRAPRPSAAFGRSIRAEALALPTSDTVRLATRTAVPARLAHWPLPFPPPSEEGGVRGGPPGDRPPARVPPVRDASKGPKAPCAQHLTSRPPRPGCSNARRHRPTPSWPGSEVPRPTRRRPKPPEHRAGATPASRRAGQPPRVPTTAGFQGIQPSRGSRNRAASDRGTLAARVFRGRLRGRQPLATAVPCCLPSIRGAHGRSENRRNGRAPSIQPATPPAENTSLRTGKSEAETPRFPIETTLADARHGPRTPSEEAARRRLGHRLEPISTPTRASKS